MGAGLHCLIALLHLGSLFPSVFFLISSLSLHFHITSLALHSISTSSLSPPISLYLALSEGNPKVGGTVNYFTHATPLQPADTRPQSQQQTMANTWPNSGHPRRNGLSKSRTTLALVVMTLLGLTSTTHAQSPSVPVSVQAPSYSRTSTYMYILGGNTTTSQVLGQFYKLDLAVPWKTAAPVWTRLADGPQQFLFPSTWSKDEKTLATFHVAKGVLSYLYSATTNTWVQSRLKVSHGDLQGVNAVTDPNTGLAYLAAGYMAVRNTMDVYNFGSDSMSSGALPPTIFQARSYYGNVWSKKRNSILYFGGYTATMQTIPDQNIVTEYVASTYVWQTMVSQGGLHFFFFQMCFTRGRIGRYPSNTYL